MSTHDLCFYEYGKLSLNYHLIPTLPVSLIQVDAACYFLLLPNTRIDQYREASSKATSLPMTSSYVKLDTTIFFLSF